MQSQPSSFMGSEPWIKNTVESTDANPGDMEG